MNNRGYGPYVDLVNVWVHVASYLESLRRYYLSGTDAFRLKLLLPLPPGLAEAAEEGAAEELASMRLTAVYGH
jgi:hypothetical protein